MKDVATVKNDLRQLKKAVHLIESMKTAQLKHLKRIEYLKMLKQNDFVKQEIEKTERLLEEFDTQKAISEANDLERRYLDYFEILEPEDRIIMIDGYINGVPCWKIGKNIGLSESGVRKRIEKVVVQMADVI